MKPCIERRIVTTIFFAVIILVIAFTVGCMPVESNQQSKPDTSSGGMTLAQQHNLAAAQ